MHVRRASSVIVSIALALMLTPAMALAGTGDVKAADRTDVERAAEQYLHAAHNAQRAAGRTRDGLTYSDVDAAPAIVGATDILTVARAWADHIDFNSFEHNPSYSDQYGHWRAVAENIGTVTIKRTALGEVTEAEAKAAAERLMENWWESGGHRRTMMNSRWDHFAVGVDIEIVQRSYGPTWAMSAVVNFRELDGTTPNATLYATSTTPPNETASAPAAPADPDARFSDVPSSHSFYLDVEALADAGVTSGCGNGRFCPDEVVTRAQMAAFLHRALSLPSGSARFTDVGTSHPFASSIGALAGAGITRGCGNGQFCPDAPVTRAQMAAFLQRALDLDAGSATFSDVRTSHTFVAPISALADAGITSGCGGGRFCPDAHVTRAQMAAFLNRAGVLD